MKKFFKHKNALVEKGATIGAGTRIWAFAHVMKEAIIGKDCNIGNFAFVESGVRLGDQVTVKNGVQIWEGIIAEDGVFFGPNVVLTNDLRPRSFIRKPKSEYLVQTKIGKGATLGANATIVCGNEIGKYAFIAAGSVVTKPVLAHAFVAGVPAKQKGWVCSCMEKISFTNNKAKCVSCGKRYVINKDNRVCSQ